jgi:hypothetical protein
MKSRGSLKLITVVMMGMCLFYGAMAFQMQFESRIVDPALFIGLCVFAGLGLVSGLVNALLTSPMLPATTAKTKLIISLALMESAAVTGFLLRVLGSEPKTVAVFFIAPVIAIGLLILPRSLTMQD